MIPQEFDYAAPTTLGEALSLLAEHGDDAKVLAGGHSLIPLMKLRLAAPGMLVDVGRIGALKGVQEGAAGDLTLGATTTHSEIVRGSPLGRAFGLLRECAAQIGDTQVRNRGTIGGSLAHADPAADLPAAILALDATMEAMHANGEGGASRTIAAGDFFTDLLTSALEPAEILTGIQVPSLPERTGTAYVKIRNKASHYALVGVAAIVTLDDAGQIAQAALGVTGAAAVPFRATAAEAMLAGASAANGAIAAAAAAAATGDREWLEDLSGSADYRRHLTEVVARRALRLAIQRARV